jgi:hypothetical protein
MYIVQTTKKNALLVLVLPLPSTVFGCNPRLTKLFLPVCTVQYNTGNISI